MSNSSATGGYLSPLTVGPKGIPKPVQDVPFEDQIGDLIAGITGLDRNLYIRPRWQLDPPIIPAVEVDWVAFGIMSVVAEPGAHLTQVDDPALAASDNDGHAVLVQHEEISMLSSFYGQNSYEYATILRDGFRIQQNWVEARSRGFSLLDSGTIRNAPEQINYTWYRRWDFDFRIRRQIDRSYDILNLKSAQGTFHADGSQNISDTWDTENV